VLFLGDNIVKVFLFTIIIFLPLLIHADYMGNDLEVNDQVILALRQFRDLKKFSANEALFYSGAPNEAIRIEAENKLNNMIDYLLEHIAKNPTMDFVLKQFEIMLKGFTNYDSEEMDRICTYCEEVMDIFNIESSDGLLMKWRYGFDVK